jgi:hypothetical protein
VFYLQQCIEKATKSFSVWNKIITEAEAKEVVGHEAWKIYSKILNEFKEKVVKLEEVCEVFPQLRDVNLIKEIKIDKLKRELSECQKIFLNKNTRWKLSFSNEELSSIITQIEKLNGLGRKIKILKTNEKETKKLKEELFQLLKTISEVNHSVIKEVEKLNNLITPQLVTNIFKKLMKIIPELIFCFLSLFYLSLIFSPHAVKSRYPQDEFNPLDIYTEKMPLIQNLSSFIKITEKVLKKLNHLYYRISSEK